MRSVRRSRTCRYRALLEGRSGSAIGPFPSMNGDRAARYQLAERWAFKGFVPASPVPIGNVVDQGAVQIVFQSKRESAMRAEKSHRLRPSERLQRRRRVPASGRRAARDRAERRRRPNDWRMRREMRNCSTVCSHTSSKATDFPTSRPASRRGGCARAVARARLQPL